MAIKLPNSQNVVTMPVDEVRPEFLMMAGADMDSRGRLFEPESDEMFGFQIRNKLHPGEDKFFKDNPNITGMAAETDDVILNPYSDGGVNKKAVAKNEAFRLQLRKQNETPNFNITNEQREAFADTSYGKNEKDLKSTIAARIYSGDPSAKATPEQTKWVESFISSSKKR